MPTEDRDVEVLKLKNERLKSLTGIVKWFLGTFLIGIVTIWVNYDIQKTSIKLEEARKQHELKLQEARQKSELDLARQRAE